MQSIEKGKRIFFRRLLGVGLVRCAAADRAFLADKKIRHDAQHPGKATIRVLEGFQA